MKHWNFNREDSNQKPYGIELDLASITVGEYIPIENIDMMNEGLKKLFKQYDAKKLSTNFEVDKTVDNFCSGVKQSIHGGHWSEFGHLHFEDDKFLKEFVKTVKVSATHISSSSIVIEFLIRPAEPFLTKFNKTVEKHHPFEGFFTINKKNFFKGWWSREDKGRDIKQYNVEDLLLEIKWRTMKKIGSYFEMYFLSNKIISPSVESYLKKEKYSDSDYIKNRGGFWDSVGFGLHEFHEVSKDGFQELFYSYYGNTVDSPLKLITNKAMPYHPMFTNLGNQVSRYNNHFARTLLPLLVMRTYSIELSKSHGSRQKKTFDNLNRRKPRYKKLVSTRYNLEKNLQILKRFNMEIDEKDFEEYEADIKSYNFYFEPTKPASNHPLWSDFIVEDTKEHLESTYERFRGFSQIVDESTRLLELKTNHSVRNWSFRFSILATAFGGFALLNDKTQEKVSSGIRSFLAWIWDGLLWIWNFIF